MIDKKASLRWGKIGSFLVVTMLSAIAMQYGSQGHPFLLADNRYIYHSIIVINISNGYIIRHYSFYLWNRILKHDHIRKLISPVFGCFVSIGVHDLTNSKGFIWLLIFIVALVLSLMPTPLLEFRYFTQAVIVALLNSPIQQRIGNTDTKVCAR